MKINRLIFADILRISATIAVITIHCVGQLFYTSLTSISSDWWWTGNIFNCSSRWEVPMFVMLSGMLLLEPTKKVSTKKILSKRLPKIFIPLIFLSVFYELYNTLYIDKSNVVPLQILQNIYTGKVQYHLWFLYLIIGLYLFTPFLKIITENLNEIEIRYFLFIWFVINGVIKTSDTFFDLQNGFYLSLFSGYVGYYILGYYLNTRTYSKIHRYWASIILGVSITLSALTTYFLVINRLQSKIDIFIGKISFFTIINSACIFIIVKSINRDLLLKNKRVTLKTIEKFSQSSYGIYLIHILIIGLLSFKTLRLSLNYKLIHPLIGIPLTVIPTMIVSYVCVQGLRKIKFMHNIVPY